jgi:hypothetical protein
MMTPKTQTIVASTVIGLTIAVALVLIPMKPDGSAIVLGMMAAFIIVWNSTKFLAKRKCSKDNWINSKVRHEILFAIILASLLLLGSISATLAKELEIFDRDLVKRIVGVNIGLMLIVLGNYMPKKLAGRSESCSCRASNASGVQRFMGWAFVLGGILYAGAWIVFDLDQAGIAIMFAFPGAIAIILAARFAYLRLTGTKSTPTQSV